MTIQVPFKRGDTFIVEGVVKIDDVIRDLTGWVVKCQLKKGTFSVTLDIEYTDRVNGVYRMRCDDTTAWPLGILRSDIQYTTDANQIISTETFEVDCLEDITSA